MAGEWREVSVQEIAERTASGPFGSNIKAGEYRESGVPVIRGLNLAGPRFLDSEYVYISEEKAKELHSSLAFPRDIVFTARGSIGSVGFVPTGKFDKYVLSPNLVKLTVNRGVADPLYVFYYFRSPLGQHEILSHASTTGVPNIARALESLRKFHVVLPPLPEQRAIAHILGTLDDKIELNRRMSETLEQMARAIFKAWFVDFEPVRAKMEGRWQRGQSLPGLPAHLYDLFPERLVNSELGEIPEGWRVVTLSEVFEINPPRQLRQGQVAPYLDMANTPTRGHTPLSVVPRAFSSGTRFVNGDTLLARITPCLENGKTAFVDFLRPGQVGWGSTEFIVLRPSPPLPPEFGYCLARHSDFREFAIQSMTGTSGRQRVQSEALALYRLAVPPRSIARAFGEFTQPLLAKASQVHNESRTLAALRDALLPRLVRGEIRVKDADRFLRERGL